MRIHPRTLAWLLVLVWSTWFTAVQQLMASSGRFGAATPDLTTVLFVSLAGAVARRDVLWLACLSALARKSFSIDPPSAILAGSLALGALAWAVRAFVDIKSPPWRVALAVAGATGLALWLQVVRAARHEGLGPELDRLLPVAGASALAALALGGLLAYLPGMSPLRSRR